MILGAADRQFHPRRRSHQLAGSYRRLRAGPWGDRAQPIPAEAPRQSLLSRRIYLGDYLGDL